MRTLPKPLRFLASIQLGIFIIVALGFVTAAGTIVEARFDTEVAAKLVYHAWPMYLSLGLLCVCLIAVMVDRWPWRLHHLAFVTAHIGILIMLFGAWVTQRFGIDGSMAFPIGQERNRVAIRDKEIAVYASIGGTEVRPIFQKDINFIAYPPSDQRPYVIHVGSEKIEVLEYQHFAFRESEMKVSDKAMDGPAVRFELQNPRVNLTEWLRKESHRQFSHLDLGPARVVLTTGEYAPSGNNEIVLRPLNENSLEMKIFDKEKKLKLIKKISQSETVETGWMGLRFRLLRFLPKSREVLNYTKAETNSPMAQPAIRFRFNNEQYWLGANSLVRLYKEQSMYILSFGQKQLALPFALRLKEFRMDRYEGTTRAATYESDVEVPGKGTVTISMNEPLKEGGFTFYQSSFEQDEMGKPTMSVLSVNHDPGRWLKYLGSFLTVLGCILLFYFKRIGRKPARTT